MNCFRINPVEKDKLKGRRRTGEEVAVEVAVHRRDHAENPRLTSLPRRSQGTWNLSTSSLAPGNRLRLPQFGVPGSEPAGVHAPLTCL